MIIIPKVEHSVEIKKGIRTLSADLIRYILTNVPDENLIKSGEFNNLKKVLENEGFDFNRQV